MTIDTSRRNFLISTSSLAGLLTTMPVVAASVTPQSPMSLSFHHLHTGESLQRTFWAEGEFIPDALAEINHLMRDHRNNQEAAMDLNLLVLLYRLQHLLETKRPVHIISAYRSPQSNALLAARSNGVAKKSLHMDAKAIDIRIPGVKLSHLRRAALSLSGGGVGYYPNSQFIHLDVGRVRQWG